MTDFNPPIIAFFNNKGGVGKTTLVYHLACMFGDMGHRVLAVDLDPQANLTAMAVSGTPREEMLYEGDSSIKTVHDAFLPLIHGTAANWDDIHPLDIYRENVGLLAGDLRLSEFEDQLSESWPKCLSREYRAFNITSAFYRYSMRIARIAECDVILFDVGPNLGAINRAALIASDYFIVPLGPDLFSKQGLTNLGPRISQWREDWKERLSKKPDNFTDDLPSGRIKPAGYIVMRYSVARKNRPVKAYARWLAQMPVEYRKSVLGEKNGRITEGAIDEYRLAELKDYFSLMPLAQRAGKPMFALTAADGAIGSHLNAVESCRQNFRDLAKEIEKRCGIGSPTRIQ